MARILPSLCIAAAAAALGACSTFRETEAVGTPRMSTIAIGSSFVRATQDSGSYGNGRTTATVTREPNRQWKGSTVAPWKQTPGPTLLLDLQHGGFYALLNGEQPAISWEPVLAWPWPMKVGQTFNRQSTMTLHANNRTVPLEQNVVVEAYEEVTMPAGTFKAFRIRTVDNHGNDDVNWFSPELTVFVKQKLTRTEKHAAGPGVRETELVSQNIRHN